MANAAALRPDQAASQLAVKRILTVAWMAVIAGIVAQLLVITVRAWAGATITLPASLADLAQGMSWSALVCVAIAVGTLASKARPHVAGFTGFIAAPLAWAAAKGVQKGVQALAHVPQDEFTPLFWTICLWKGVEYAALGAGITLLIGQPTARAGAYLTFGGLLGMLGGSVSVALTIANAILTNAATIPTHRVAGLVAGEVFFASACCFVIYMAQELARHINVLKGA